MDVNRDREWERAYFFAPYTTKTELNRVLGFECEVCMLVELDRRDDLNLLVQVRGSKEVRVEELPRSDVEIDSVLLGRPFEPSATFRIGKANGRIWLQAP